MTTTVVNIRTEECDIYVGRPNGRRKLKGHPLANPYPLVSGVSREEVIADYAVWLAVELRATEVKQLLNDMRGKRLGCWCAPLPCHADILAQVADMTDEERQAWADDVLTFTRVEG